jgi:hypothetical protein
LFQHIRTTVTALKLILARSVYYTLNQLTVIMSSVISPWKFSMMKFNFMGTPAVSGIINLCFNPKTTTCCLRFRTSHFTIFFMKSERHFLACACDETLQIELQKEKTFFVCSSSQLFSFVKNFKQQ